MKAEANSNQKIMLLEVADTLLRSWWTVVAGVCLGLAAAVLVLHYTPRVFEASARVSMGTEMLPNNVVEDTVIGDPDVQLAAVEGNVMTDRYLDEVVTAVYGAGDDADRFERLKQRVRAGSRVSRPGWAEYFEVRFQDTNPVTAAKIANMLADFFVVEGRVYRHSRAADTTQTIRELAESRWQDLHEKKQELDAYLAEHPYRTEADRAMNLQLLTQARADLESAGEERETLVHQIDLLEAQQAQDLMMGDYLSPSTGPTGSFDSVLARLESELRELTIKYSESHPSVREKRTEIAEHLARMPPAPETPPDEPAPAPDPSLTSTIWDASIRAAQATLRELIAREKGFRRDIAEYQRRLEDTSVVQRHMDDLNRDLASLQGEFDQLTGDAIDAETSERVEEKGRGKQFEVLAYAGAPSTPIRPQPMMIAGAATAIGLFLFVGPQLIRAFLMPVIRSESRLSAVTDIPILVTVPSITTPTIVRRKRVARLKNFGLSCASAGVLAAVLGLRYTGVL